MRSVQSGYFRRYSFRMLGVAAISIAIPAMTGLVLAQQRQVFTAAVIGTGGPNASGVAGRVTLVIERWTDSEQTTSLKEALKAGGNKGMLDRLRDLPDVGTISMPGSIGYPLKYAAQQTIPDGGRRIIIATDRPVSFGEAFEQSRSLDYPFTFIELHVDKNGNGEGILTLAAKVSPAGNDIVLENWEVSPVNLTDVRQQGQS